MAKRLSGIKIESSEKAILTKVFAESLQSWISKTVHRGHSFEGFFIFGACKPYNSLFMSHLKQKKSSRFCTIYGLGWIIKPKLIRVLSFSVCYNSERADRLHLVSNVISGLIGVTKNILMEKRYSFMHQKGVVLWKKPWKKKFQIS